MGLIYAYLIFGGSLGISYLLGMTQRTTPLPMSSPGDRAWLAWGRIVAVCVVMALLWGPLAVMASHQHGKVDK